MLSYFISFRGAIETTVKGCFDSPPFFSAHNAHSCFKWAWHMVLQMNCMHVYLPIYSLILVAIQPTKSSLFTTHEHNIYIFSALFSFHVQFICWEYVFWPLYKSHLIFVLAAMHKWTGKTWFKWHSNENIYRFYGMR